MMTLQQAEETRTTTFLQAVAAALPAPVARPAPTDLQWETHQYGSIVRRARVYELPDGQTTITVPAWNDFLSPFGSKLGQVRRWYEEAEQLAPWTLAQDGIRVLLETVAARTAALRQNLRETFERWVALFPFDPFTVTEEEYFTWAVRHATGYGQWEPGIPIKPARGPDGQVLPIRCVVGDRFYETVTAGWTGHSRPTHEAGEVSDGGVIWRYVGSGQIAGDCDLADLPPAREFRNQWRVAMGAVREDPQLVAEEVQRRFLAERDARLEASYKLLLDAMESGEGLETVKAYRQRLRTLEATPVQWPLVEDQHD